MNPKKPINKWRKLPKILPSYDSLLKLYDIEESNSPGSHGGFRCL